MSRWRSPIQVPVPPGMVGADERVLLSIRPSLLYVFLSRAETLIGCAVAAIAGRWLAERSILPIDPRLATAMGMAAASMLLIWLLLDWGARLYVLTNRRVVRRAGVLRRVTTEAPVTNIQSVTVAKLVRERAFGLGTLLFTTAGGPPGRFAWVMIAEPEAVTASVRHAMDEARSVLPLPGALS